MRLRNRKLPITAKTASRPSLSSLRSHSPSKASTQSMKSPTAKAASTPTSRSSRTKTPQKNPTSTTARSVTSTPNVKKRSTKKETKLTKDSVPKRARSVTPKRTAANRRSRSKSTSKRQPSTPSKSLSSTLDASAWKLFSSNPEKQWAEKWYLWYSFVWPALFGGWCMSGKHLEVGDMGNLAVTIGIGSPNILVPLFFAPRASPTSPFWESYWFKNSLWIAIFTFVASYFFTEYFFDVLGMVYHFPHLKWNFDSVLVGSGKQVVPLMMYVHAWYFFLTYHACSVVVIRLITTSPLTKYMPSILCWVVGVVVTAWFFSVAEIYLTTMDAIEDLFRYKDVDWALSRGAWGYACYFISSFPMVYWLDEEPQLKWTLRKTIENALAASMLSFILLDLVCQFVVTDWKELKF